MRTPSYVERGIQKARHFAQHFIKHRKQWICLIRFCPEASFNQLKKCKYWIIQHGAQAIQHFTNIVVKCSGGLTGGPVGRLRTLEKK